MPAHSDIQAPAWLDGEALKDKLKNLPIPLQALISGGLALLLALDLAVMDFLPLIDELVLGWLLFSSASTTFGAIRERRAAGRLEAPDSRVIDVRDQQAAEPADDLADVLMHAAQKEVEALEGTPF